MIGPTLISGLHQIVVLRPPTKWKQRDAMPQQKAPGPITAAVNRAPVDYLGETRENNKFDRLEARGERPPKTKLLRNWIGYRVRDVRTWLDRRRMSEHAAT